jgi:hypothetical protein
LRIAIDDHQAVDTGEIVGIEGDQREPVGDRGGGDLHVEGTG